MKKILLTLTLTTALGMTTNASADMYAQFGFGSSINGGSATYNGIKRNYKNTPAYSLALGYETLIPFFSPRLEVEYLSIHPNVKNGPEVKFDGAFLNGYTLIPLIPLVDPYIGAGIGMTRFNHNNTAAVQGMAGIEYTFPILPLTVGGEYRYLRANEDGGKANNHANYHSNSFLLKVRYSF